VDRKKIGGLSLQTSLGLLIQGETLSLALVSRRLRSVRLLDTLILPSFRQKPVAEVRSEISAFLSRNRVTHFRGVVVVPREDVIVRQLDLPGQAEANLAKVVEYQVATLVPSESATICYDYCVSGQASQSKNLQVTVFLLTKAWLDQTLQLCESLGFRVDVVVPSSIALANYFLLLSRRFKAETALVAHWQDSRCEMVGIFKKTFHHSREVDSSEPEETPEVLQTEVELFRGRTGLSDEAPLDVFVVGNVGGLVTVPAEKRFKVHRFSLPQHVGVELGTSGAKVSEIQDRFLALAAGLSGLRKKNPVSINLLPLEKRLQRSKWTWVPTYALLGANVLLLFSLIVRKPLQQQAYSAQLSEEVSRLEPEVRKIRSVEDQIADLRRRADLLRELKRSNEQPLNALNELSQILPKNAWVYDFNMRNQSMEIYGASGMAAALPQILDNSPHFKDAEFIAPILRDGQGNEIYRIRVKMEQAGSSTQEKLTPRSSEAKTSERSQGGAK
jgi:Tfp pilus assembly protein PilN